MNNKNNSNIKRKLVLSARLAKTLIHEGYQIIDITPLKNDNKRTCFIFADDGTLDNAIEKILLSRTQNTQHKEKEATYARRKRQEGQIRE